MEATKLSAATADMRGLGVRGYWTVCPGHLWVALRQAMRSMASTRLDAASAFSGVLDMPSVFSRPTTSVTSR